MLDNKKGSIGSFVLFFIGVVVVLALLPTIATNVSSIRDTRTATNVTYTSPATANGSFVDLDGTHYIGGAIVTNATDGSLISNNVTIDHGISATTGSKTVRLVLNGVADGTIDLTSVPLNVSYEFGATGYSDSSGTRGIAGLITIMAALGLLGFAVFYGLEKIKDVI